MEMYLENCIEAIFLQRNKKSSLHKYWFDFK